MRFIYLFFPSKIDCILKIGRYISEQSQVIGRARLSKESYCILRKDYEDILFFFFFFEIICKDELFTISAEKTVHRVSFMMTLKG